MAGGIVLAFCEWMMLYFAASLTSLANVLSLEQGMELKKSSLDAKHLLDGLTK
jgi:hypothetical protein